MFSGGSKFMPLLIYIEINQFKSNLIQVDYKKVINGMFSSLNKCSKEEAGKNDEKSNL